MNIFNLGAYNVDCNRSIGNNFYCIRFYMGTKSCFEFGSLLIVGTMVVHNILSEWIFDTNFPKAILSGYKYRSDKSVNIVHRSFEGMELYRG